jgi:hypothetical protein
MTLETCEKRLAVANRKLEADPDNTILPYEIKFWEKKIEKRILRIKERMQHPDLMLRYIKYATHPLITEQEVKKSGSSSSKHKK